MMIDADARYLQSHEWVKKTDGNVFTVGLSAYAIEQLGDIVYMELPEAGAEFAAGDAFGVVESVKSASDMYMPIGGKVVEVNESVPDGPDVLKTDAYGAGWMIKIEASDPSEFDALMDEAAYKKFLETEV
ncbi:MAG: glycine cleavage system protein GcvH [Planctomycetota bacterium]|jgi:glycine cleavage system H protein